MKLAALLLVCASLAGASQLSASRVVLTEPLAQALALRGGVAVSESSFATQLLAYLPLVGANSKQAGACPACGSSPRACGGLPQADAVKFVAVDSSFGACPVCDSSQCACAGPLPQADASTLESCPMCGTSPCSCGGLPQVAAAVRAPAKSSQCACCA